MALLLASGAADSDILRARPSLAFAAVATDNCTCHMPKYEVRDMHFEFTDHMIRIVKKTG